MAKVKGPTFDQWLTIAGVGAAGLVLYELYINQGAIQAAIQTALNPNTAANNIYMQQGYTCPQGGYPTSTGICPNGQMAQAPGFGSAGYGQFCLGGGQPINGICPNGQMATSMPQLTNTNLPTGYGGLCSDGSTPNPVTGLCANGTFPSSVSPSTPFGGLPPPYSNILGGGTLYSPGGGDFGGGGWGGGGDGGNWGGWNSPFNQQNQQQTLNPLGPGLSYSCNDGSTPGSAGTCANGSQPTIISTPTTTAPTTPTSTGPTTITTPNPSGTMGCADGSTPSNGLCANGQAPSTALPAGTPSTPSGTVPSTATPTGTGTTTVTPTPAPAPAPTPTTTPTATSTPGTGTPGTPGGQPLPATTGQMSGQQQGTTHRRFGMVGYQSEGAMMAAQAMGVRPKNPYQATATGYSTVSPKHGNMPMTSHIFNRRFYSPTPIYVSGIH